MEFDQLAHDLKQYTEYGDSLEVNLSEKLDRKVIDHRNHFAKFFKGRYLEALATLFSYNIPEPFQKSVVEIALRDGLGVAFGNNKLNQPTILGFTTDFRNISQPYEILYRKRLTAKNIYYIIPKELRPPLDTLELVPWDGGKTGGFTVIRNKQMHFTNDFNIICHYANELAEIVGSRYSLIMQSKFMTAIMGEPEDETANQVIEKLYNGNPFIKISNGFDPVDNIVKIDNPNLGANLEQLKQEYQNKIAELNSLFGINVLSVNKQSGVTTSEANGNLGFVTMNGNIWLESRQQALDLYNAHYNTDYKVSFDADAIGILDKGGEGNEDNNDTGGDNPDASQTK